MARPAIGDKPDLAALTGFKPHRSTGGDIQPHPMGGSAVKAEAGICLGKVVMRPDLHRTVAGIGDHQRHSLGPDIQGDVAIGGKDLSGDHGVVLRLP